MPLTPVEPFGLPVSGAGRPCQVRPPSSVRATDVQISGLALSQCPGVPAGPMIQPVFSESQVAEEGWKSGGRYPAAADPEWAVPDAALLDVAWIASLLPTASGDCVAPLELTGFPASRLVLVGVVVRWSDMPTGTAMPTTAATAAALATETTALRTRRRRARLVISSKVPDGGSSGRTCWSSQRSSASCA
jgi:hypothetical protein